MIQEFLKYIAIYASSMFKFILGPALGTGFGFSFWITGFLTAAGMMTSVFLFSSLLGKTIHCWIMRTFFKDKRRFNKRTRKTVKIWRNYGLKGVAFLTPIVFTPIGGTILATSFGEHRKKIFKYMLVSAVFWGFIISFALATFNLQIQNILISLKVH
jgi:hypothetical protein